MNMVCRKPIDLPVLLKAINTLLGEKIHTSIPKAPSKPQNRQATDQGAADQAAADNGAGTEDRSGPAADDASFAQVLERVSNLADQLAELNNKDAAPSVKIEGVPMEQLAELTAKYEKRQIERSDELKMAFGALTISPADDEIRGKVKSLTHAIKGGGGTYCYHLTTEIATEADDLLAAKDTLDEADIQVLANYVEALSLIALKKLSGHGGKAGRILMQGLKDFSTSI